MSLRPAWTGLAAIVLLLTVNPAHAQDAGAIANGNWNDPTIWTTATVPGASNNVFIGSVSPPGRPPWRP